MPVSADIYTRSRPRVAPISALDALLERSQEQDVRMKSQQTQQAYDDDQALRKATTESGGDENKLLSLLQQGGRYGAAEKLKTSILDRQKKGADITKVGAETTEKLTDNQVKQIGIHTDMLSNVQTPEDAAQWAQIGKESGALNESQYQMALKNIQRVSQDPQAFANWKNQAALGAKKYVEMNKPIFSTANTGNAQVTTAREGLTGQIIPGLGQSQQIFQSPDNAASNARMAADAAASRDVQRRGQDLVNSRARESNDINRSLTNEKKQFEVDDLRRQKEGAISSAATQISVIDKALSHPGRETSTGLSGTLDPRNYVAGTDAADFRAVLDQIGGTAFLQAFQSLKGGGQITEVEGKKATDAIARLSRAQSDAEFKKSLKDLREVMTTGYKRLSGNDYQTPGQPVDAPSSKPVKVASDADYNALPSGSTFIGPDGKTRRKP